MENSKPLRDEILSQLVFSPDGLIPAVIQDHKTGCVLMVAYMNKEALRRTLETGKTWFWSRKRQSLWLKGETSGHYQLVKEIRADCDKDTLLINVEQAGVACHDGFFSCFYRRLNERGEFEIEENEAVGAAAHPLDSPAHSDSPIHSGSPAHSDSPVYPDSPARILDELYDVIKDRKENPLEGSYTSRLMASGLDRILRKVGEESGEFIIAAKNGISSDIVAELADLWYHSLVALASQDIPFSALCEELKKRRAAHGGRK